MNALALAQGMSGLALILGYALLCVTRPQLGVWLVAGQALAVAAAALAVQLPVVAAVDALGGGFLVPLLMQRFGVPTGSRRHRDWAMPLTLAAAAVTSLLAATGGALALPLAILLLALLQIAARPAHPVFGLCGLQQAAVLAACTGTAASPLLAPAVALPLLPGLALAAAWALRQPGLRRL